MRNNKVILPPQTIGIIGGGQLGRMMSMAAKYMGYNVIVLDPTPNCPAAQVSDAHIIAAYHDMNAIKELTEKSDVITYEFENVDLHAANYIENNGKLPQGAYALEITQNREKEKKLINELGLPTPKFTIVHQPGECKEALADFRLPVVVKTCHGGYDGKGQLKIDKQEDIEQLESFVAEHGHCILESWLTFDREISVIFTRTAEGEMAFFPIAENVHQDHILFQTTVPANISPEVEEKAYQAARTLAERMQVVGTFAIEMFVDGESIYLNEMAPRPHNSGHFTIEACNISQFAQHIRAICGLPLLAVKLLEPATMVNILGESVEATVRSMSKVGNGFVHLYGKDEPKTKRKMGHITFIGEDYKKQLEMFEEAKK
ncbi:5-(carboxyamino)imidazole ribonucleotide synthase [Ornithinibacillus scapharcae]|uniref:5-(carboxyamino)imidazole ribonucleotide synthase n=1 Tax=Ornithinibacillus scapharcae TaxID=1147159 RepID=UPI000225BF02|nr:5-(carboxyamino)imidazole ribonucleotide synthase [Ornithinibacillus scapharcae]